MEKTALIASGYTGSNEQGIYRLSYDAKTNTFSDVKLAAATHNPSIGIKHGAFWYFVEESAPGKIHVFDTTNNWKKLSTVDCGGASPCHLSLNADASHLAVANYMGGNIAVFTLEKSGLPKPGPQMIQHHGQGLTPRQEAPHAHYAAFGTDANQLPGVYAVDLGIDQIFWYPEISSGVWGDGRIALQAQPGDGPRHLAVHPTNGKIYVLNELSNILGVHELAEDGRFITVQRENTLPNSFHGESIAAHIGISKNGQFIYTSNRGHQSLAVFKILTDGLIELIQIVSCGGIWPRYFTLLSTQTHLIVAHEHSNSLAAFAIAPDGRLQDTAARACVPQPTFIAEE